MTSLLEARLARCTCALWTEAPGVRDAKRRRYRRGYGHYLTRTPRLYGERMRMWDPNVTETEFNGKIVPRYFWPPYGHWLDVEDFFISDAMPRPPACHHYCEVEMGQTCHRCKKKVVARWSGIACPCKHTWYCA